MQTYAESRPPDKGIVALAGLLIERQTGHHGLHFDVTVDTRRAETRSTAAGWARDRFVVDVEVGIIVAHAERDVLAQPIIEAAAQRPAVCPLVLVRVDAVGGVKQG